MLSVLILIAIGFAVWGFIAYSNTNDEGWCVMGGVGAVTGSLLLIVICIMLGFIASTHRIDMRIAMYEEENTKIERSVVSAVEKYLEHEQSIFEDISDDMQTLLIVYPEIKADALITKQIEVFIENNTKIKELKEEKISIGTLKFLVYFGG